VWRPLAPSVPYKRATYISPSLPPAYGSQCTSLELLLRQDRLYLVPASGDLVVLLQGGMQHFPTDQFFSLLVVLCCILQRRA